MPKRLWIVGLPSLLAAACSSSPVTQPPLRPCTATSGGQVTLGIGAYAAVDPTQTAGCAVFPANPLGSGIEYVVVPQSASSIPDDSQGFELGGKPLPASGYASPNASLRRSFPCRCGRRLASRRRSRPWTPATSARSRCATC